VTTPTNTLRIGVIGLGYWGRNLVRNLVELEGIEIAYLCDLRPEILDRASRRYRGITCSTDVDTVLRDRSVAAVAIATPVESHYSLALAALEQDKHLFVEKPLAKSSEQARRLIEESSKRNLVLMPGHTFLYSPSVVAIKRLIDSGELGTIHFVSTSRVNLGLHQPDVSVVWDLGPHDFSILRYWLDELPEYVSAVSRDCIVPGTPDVAFVNLAYPSRTIAHVELSWLAPSKLRRTAIVASEKMVVYDDTSKESVRVFDSGASLRDPETYGEYGLSYRTGDIVSPRIEAAEPLALELADFRSAILHGTSLRSSPQVGLDVVRTIEAVDSSLGLNGLPVSLDADLLPTQHRDQVATEHVAEVRSADGIPNGGTGDTAALEPQPAN
jgi:predicted dehydrogenase